MAKAFRKSRSMLVDLSTDAGLVVVDLLRVLKSKYNYKALSRITGCPVSTLTRYITGKTAPRGAKAERLLRNLLNNINLPALITEGAEFDGGELDLTKIMLNPNLIKIIGAFILGEFAGMKITSILPLDFLSMPLASYLATSISRPIHLISSDPISADGHSIPLVFPDNGGGAARAYWLFMRKNCRGESVLMLSSRAPDPRFFDLLLKTLIDHKIELGGFFSVAVKEEELRALKIPPGVKRSYILIT
ncbi:MAG: hypothetical protein J7L79_01985 [Thaumarchaeota archaeon]|nr:hypothetical protein [Nitrososphaerota archaeon]